MATTTIKIGPEFLVNTYTSDSQTQSSIASLADGGFVVTWTSYQRDGSESNIYGQRYDANGNRVGLEFQINTHTSNTQSNPSVAPLAGGGFIVTWDSYEQDGSSYGIYGQRYDANGVRISSEFPINTYTEDSRL
jgi:hypothetical protein